MIAEGRIIIEMGQNGDVRLNSNRGVDVARMLVGRGPGDVLDLLPRLFSLCGHAHVAAARRAMFGPLAEMEMRSDSLMVLSENAREHLLRILTCWRAKGDPPALAGPSIMSLVSGMKTALGGSKAEQDQADNLANFLAADVLALGPAQFLDLEDIESFCGWLSGPPTPVKDHLSGIIAKGWEALGASQPNYLPYLPEDLLFERFNNPEFSIRPDWQGQPYETGTLERQSRHPLVVALVETHGTGLLARMVARLVELAQIPERMKNGDCLVSGGDGLGIVETARGRLIHAVRQESGVIADYRILAPTEWNFHPQGVAVQALRTLPAEPDLSARASALIEAIDPCVAFEVRAV
ncbi:nickel-dependent hydrogenase large subunit [Alisedimentitalea sp. MJ-SS2]|uniref:nickel-dependent hydrogenase large subunit n=1 Tax=Aliisedimentitalea sp. MJ-SS2 TaxID=3049795 RepID=UPI00290FE35F|nr:nickel-dependent hydrogenase large subunit [Alisedimentitalea sp. MJ-SS2]MDU8929652.1 nickel-dependent hydrogenase large subunit [Alisedimentitalea sp. MJ-SS2]